MSMTPAERQKAFRERQKARMAVDPEYALQVKTKKSEQDSRYYQSADKNKLRAQSRARNALRMANDPEYVERRRRQTKESIQRNREKVLAYKKRYREENQEAISEYMKQWELKNRDKRYAINAKRRMSVKSPAEPISRIVVWDRDQGVCGICGENACHNDWHLDHIVPLSRGGLHVYDNVQVSHPKCNLSKNAKLPSEMALTTGGG